MSAPRKPKPLSVAMIAALRGARDHGNPYAGCMNQSEYGGRTGSTAALRRRGLLTSLGTITDAGREALESKERRS